MSLTFILFKATLKTLILSPLVGDLGVKSRGGEFFELIYYLY